MRFKLTLKHFLFLSLLLFVFVAGSAHGIRSVAGEQPLKIVTTIRPLQSLANGVLKNYGEAVLLNDINANPHAGQLKPSSARHIQSADIFVTVDSNFERGLKNALDKLVKKDAHIAISSLTGIRLLAQRNIHDTTHTHIDKKDADGKRVPARDPHLWLDISNAKYFVRYLAQELAKKDKTHEALFLQNAAHMTKMLDQLDADIRKELKRFPARPYFITHDAYQYFEGYFGQKAGDILVIDQNSHGAIKLSKIRNLREAIKVETLEGTKTVCLFYDQHNPPSMVEALTKGLAVKSLELNPLGKNEVPFTDGYFSMMRTIAHQFSKCFSG